jgi:hypothetical protein
MAHPALMSSAPPWDLNVDQYSHPDLTSLAGASVALAGASVAVDAVPPGA